MKQTVIKYMIPKEVIFEDGDDLGKRIVETAEQLGADTYHHVKMIDEEKKEDDQKYYQVIIERDYVASGLIWILASNQDEAVEIASQHKNYSIFTSDNMEMADLGKSDRFSATYRVLTQDEMPDFIHLSRSQGTEIYLDQDIIDRDDGG
jgi:hypothetical protein